MSRKSIPIQPAVIEARKRLKAFLHQSNLTPTELSRRIGLNQSTVQRFLEGRIKTLTPATRKMLSYACIDVNECINHPAMSACDNRHIRQALERVWDGDEEKAKRLARLIELIAPVLELCPSSTVNRKDMR